MIEWYGMYAWKIACGTLGLRNITLKVQKLFEINMKGKKISEIEFNCVSGWQLTPLGIKMMNGFMMIESISS